MSHPKTVVPEEVSAEEAAALETIAAEVEADDHYHITMSVMSGEILAKIEFIEEDIAAKTGEPKDIAHQLEILNTNLLLEKEKLKGVNLVLSVIEKGGIEFLRK